MLEVMTVEGDGTFDFEDPFGKWYESDDFADFLKEFVGIGELHFDGEDFESWGYAFDGKGNVKRMDRVWKVV